MSHRRSIELLAYVKKARAGSLEAVSHHVPAVSARATALGGQFRTFVWLHFWIPIVLCTVAVCLVWPIRPPEENLPDLGVPVVRVVPVFVAVAAVLFDTDVRL